MRQLWPSSTEANEAVHAIKVEITNKIVGISPGTAAFLSRFF
jgi:hypothetical protein